MVFLGRHSHYRFGCLIITCVATVNVWAWQMKIPSIAPLLVERWQRPFMMSSNIKKAALIFTNFWGLACSIQCCFVVCQRATSAAWKDMPNWYQGARLGLRFKSAACQERQETKTNMNITGHQLSFKCTWPCPNTPKHSPKSARRTTSTSPSIS